MRRSANPSAAIPRDLPIADDYRLVDAFIDLVEPALPLEQGRWLGPDLAGR